MRLCACSRRRPATQLACHARQGGPCKPHSAQKGGSQQARLGYHPAHRKGWKAREKEVSGSRCASRGSTSHTTTSPGNRRCGPNMAGGSRGGESAAGVRGRAGQQGVHECGRLAARHVPQGRRAAQRGSPQPKTHVGNGKGHPAAREAKVAALAVRQPHNGPALHPWGDKERAGVRGRPSGGAQRPGRQAWAAWSAMGATSSAAAAAPRCFHFYRPTSSAWLRCTLCSGTAWPAGR